MLPLSSVIHITLCASSSTEGLLTFGKEEDVTYREKFLLSNEKISKALPYFTLNQKIKVHG